MKEDIITYKWPPWSRRPTAACLSCIAIPRRYGGEPQKRNDVRRYVWGALTAVAVSLAIVGFTHGSGTNPSYSFLLTDWVRRPDMVSQCMIGLNRGTNPQDQDVWKAMGIKDPQHCPTSAGFAIAMKDSGPGNAHFSRNLVDHVRGRIFESHAVILSYGRRLSSLERVAQLPQ